MLLCMIASTTHDAMGADYYSGRTGNVIGVTKMRDFAGDPRLRRAANGAYSLKGRAPVEGSMIAVWARILVLAAGWLAALGTAQLAGALLGIPKLPVLLTSGSLWTCLLLLQ
jgi:hypothetical protein